MENCTNNVLNDGFTPFSNYLGHRLPVLGLVLLDEAIQTIKTPSDQLITFDMKQIHMWRFDRVIGTTKVIKVIKFPKEKPNFIVNIVFIQKFQLIIMSAADLTLRLYDRDLNFLEAIRHQEGAILHMEFDHVRM
jgi:hypothetical protein